MRSDTAVARREPARFDPARPDPARPDPGAPDREPASRAALALVPPAGPEPEPESEPLGDEGEFLFRRTARDRRPPRAVVTAAVLGDPAPGRRRDEVFIHRADAVLRCFDDAADVLEGGRA